MKKMKLLIGAGAVLIASYFAISSSDAFYKAITDFFSKGPGYTVFGIIIFTLSFILAFRVQKTFAKKEVRDDE